jgi:hypothetical protein
VSGFELKVNGVYEVDSVTFQLCFGSTSRGGIWIEQMRQMSHESSGQRGRDSKSLCLGGVYMVAYLNQNTFKKYSINICFYFFHNLIFKL